MIALLIGLLFGSAGPPAPRLIAPKESVAGAVAFRFSSPAKGLRYRCALDSAAAKPCTSPHVVRLGPGIHAFRVQAVDQQGRRSAFARASVEVAPASVRVGQSPVALTFGAGALWTADYGGGTVTRIERGTVKAKIAIGGQPSGVAFAGGSIWVGDFGPNGLLTRVDPARNAVVAHVALGGQPAGLLGAGNTLWVADNGGFVDRVDTATNMVVARVPIGGNPEALALGFNLLWVTNQDGTLSAVDPATNAVAGAKVTGDRDLDAVAIAPDAVWATSFSRGTLLKIDPVARRVLRRVRLGGEGAGVLVLGRSVYASVYDAGLVVRVNAATGRIVERLRVGSKPRDIVFDGRTIWVVNQGSNTVSRVKP